MIVRRPTHRSGMSLMEVLVSLAIFLICFSAIGALVDSASNMALSARFQNTGTRLATSKLAEVEAGLVPVSTGGSGDFSADGDDGWSWTVTSTPMTIPNLYSVTVTVSKTLQGQPFEVTLTQTMFDPLQMGTGAGAQPPAPATGTGS
ncbi:MAG: prepilin-type N-terminal cleavage/methylation domain-containing protein [Gemmataceae bacterium]